MHYIKNIFYFCLIITLNIEKLLNDLNIIVDLTRTFKVWNQNLNCMPKKRTSRGRTKGGKGSSGTVHCSQCGAMVPRDKAKKITGRVTLVEPTLAKELRAQGAYISPATDVKFYCVSCAVHRGIVKVRSELERRMNTRLR
jgi:small subunit ribosomal protein S26e